MEPEPMAAPRGASVWERKMFDYLVEHTRVEGAMLKQYVDTAEGTDSKAFEYVIKLLVEDELRHHRMFNELAASLKSEAELSAEDPVIPRLDFDRIERTELLRMTRDLLAHERDDAAELKRLRKELRDVEDTTLWGLLVDIMARDTEKHIAILKFVVDHAK